MVFTALVMLLSRYHSYRSEGRISDLFIPSIPFLAVSVVANAVNYSPIGSDYMFFKLNSFIFAPIGAATPDILATALVYVAYLFIHAMFYMPSFFMNLKKKK